MTRNEKFKAEWMRAFEEKVLAQDKKHAGKIEWDAANHFYFIGKTSQGAADQYVENRK